jgi:hypothetical protein
MKIDFDSVMVFSDVARTQGEIKSIRKYFADFLYTQQNGILAYALSRKIFNATDDTEFTPEEVELIRAYSQDLPPCYIDAISEMLYVGEEDRRFPQMFDGGEQKSDSINP